MYGGGDADVDVEIIPPTPVTVMRVAVGRRGEVGGGVGVEGECVKAEEGGSSMARLCAEGREVSSQMRDVQMGAESTARRTMGEEVKVEVVENGWESKASGVCIGLVALYVFALLLCGDVCGFVRQSSVARMASFLAHEAEAEVAAAAAMARESALQLRCEALSRDLSDARSANEEVMAQLVEVQRRLHKYEAKEEVESQCRVRQLCMRVDVVVLAVVNPAGCKWVIW